MSSLERFVAVVARVNGAVAVVFFLALTIVVALQVFTRFVLHAPLIWSEEVGRFLFFWTVLLGAALSVHHRWHFVIDVLPQGEGAVGRAAALWRAVPAVIIACFCLFLLVEGVGYAQIGLFRTGTNSRVNMALVYAAIPVFAGLSLLYALTQTAADIRHARGGEQRAPVPPPAD